MVVKRACTLLILFLASLLCFPRVLFAQETYNNSEAFVFKQRVSNPTPFVAERIFYTLELVSPLPIKVSRLRPRLDSFSEHGTRQEIRQETRDGKVYNVLRFITAIYPVQSGLLEIAPQRIALKDVLDLESSAQTYTFIETEKLVLNVKEIPALPKNLKINQAQQILVGTTSLEMRVHNKTLILGESTTLDLILRSASDLSILNYHLQGTGGVLVYENPPLLSLDRENTKYQFQKHFSYTLLPTKEGPLTISSEGFYIFDPQNANYSALVPAKINLQVNRTSQHFDTGQPEPALQASLPDKEHPKETLRYHEANPMERFLSLFSTSSLLLFSLFIVLSIITVRIHMGIRKKRSPSTPPCIEELKKAETLSELRRLFGTGISSIIAVNGSTLPGLRESIKESIHDSELRIHIENLLHELSVEIYSQKEPSARRIKVFKQRALRILEALLRR